MTENELSKLKIDKAAWSGAGKRPAGRALRVALAVAAGVLLILAVRHIFPPAVEVDTSAVSQIYPSQGLTLLNSSGYVTAQRKASVASRTTARLVWLGVEEGSRLRKDEVIARLEQDDVLAARDRAGATFKANQADIERVQSELTDAAQNLERMKLLLADKSIAQADYDAAEARFKKAQAGVSVARWTAGSSGAALRESTAALGYTLLRAPFDGVVLTKNADVGDIVTPLGAAANAKSSVVTIADLGSLLVETDVSESNVSKVKAGAACEIMLDALPGERFPGLVHMIVPTADRTKGSVLVKVKFRALDPRILPEMSAKVAFLSRELSESERVARLGVPAAAVVEQGGRKVVFQVADGVASAVPVETGARIGDFLELASGPKAGARVVMSPPAGLKSGARVMAKK
ncbi:MAG: efflux RND transporter periplasmic adaptor subunit [Proteobacteria bacterium]|nr:efflux RND transporter periplasmic adaptor subunit [Pseudomonadota bacterium]MBU1594329.1 efflux RND transporter periplasmic adaptor subunit [Pseudomonadota bacterium]